MLKGFDLERVLDDGYYEEQGYREREEEEVNVFGGVN